jgi:hypothetical protein
MNRSPYLTNETVQIEEDDAFPEPGHASVVVRFSNGARLKAGYWRLISDGRVALSSFDHKQRYGLPKPIDAKKSLHAALDGRTCLEARLDTETADVLVTFSDGTRLQVLRLTGYEDWEFAFPDGQGDYSNHV